MDVNATSAGVNFIALEYWVLELQLETLTRCPDRKPFTAIPSEANRHHL